MGVNNIVKGFMGKKPVGEEWYEERLKICGDCPLNTANMEPKDISLIQITQSKTVCHGGGVCTACGCCVLEKASVKAEECGKVKINEQPLWNKVEDILNIDPYMKLRTLSPTDLTLDFIDKQPRIKKTFDPKTEPKVTIKLLLTDKRGLNVLKVVAGCSCTASSVRRLSNVQTELTLDISTIGFTLDVNERSVTVHRGNGRNLVITLQFTKDKNEL